MQRIFFYCLLIAWFAISGCGNSNQVEQVRKIDSLQNICDTLGSRLASLNYDSLTVLFRKVSSTTSVFESKMMALPKNMKVRDCLNQHGAIHKGIKRFLKEYPVFQKNLEFSKLQLANLKNDVSKDLLKDGEFQKFFNEEAAVVTKMSAEIMERTEIIKKEISTLSYISPTIIMVVDSLNRIPDAGK